MGREERREGVRGPLLSQGHPHHVQEVGTPSAVKICVQVCEIRCRDLESALSTLSHRSGSGLAPIRNEVNTLPADWLLNANRPDLFDRRGSLFLLGPWPFFSASPFIGKQRPDFG